MRTINDLVAANIITQLEANIYTLYVDNPIGANYLREMVEDTYMDLPAPEHFNNEALAYSAGRRSVFQHIKSVIATIDKLKNEDDTNDYTNRDEPTRLKYKPIIPTIPAR